MKNLILKKAHVRARAAALRESEGRGRDAGPSVRRVGVEGEGW